jgi:hypothetical protein
MVVCQASFFIFYFLFSFCPLAGVKGKTIPPLPKRRGGIAVHT